jgi:hypothetical protein
MLADRLVVESRRAERDEAACWHAGSGAEIELSSGLREAPGTTVTLHLKSSHHRLAEQPEPLEAAVKEFADFLRVPIYLNRGKARVNVSHSTWFEPTPEAEAIELELEGYFGETPLDVITVRRERPVTNSGALYVTPRRTPGFSGEPVVTATVRRMVISRKIQGLLPDWAAFFRGVLELNDCTPNLSREDLVHDAAFAQARATLGEILFSHLERLAREDRTRLDSVVAWHRYTFCGAALSERRLRDLLRQTYRLTTSQGLPTFAEIHEQSVADPIVEADAQRVIWYNTDRRQEAWANTLFAGYSAPCVHALLSFEESLLAAWAADASEGGEIVDLRLASPGSPGFALAVLGVRDIEEAPSEWQEFLGAAGAKVLCASFREDRPVMAFPNERSELVKVLSDLKTRGTIPAGFQRMIDMHLESSPPRQNEVLLNRDHRLVGRQSTIDG